MAAPKRRPFERERDLELVTRLYCKGVTQREIAERLGVSREQVKYDIKQLTKKWRTTENILITELKQRELTKIDHLEFEAWEAFERSKQDHVKIVEEETTGGKLGGGSKSGKTIEGQYGDPRFMQIVTTCVEKRCKILGLDEPVKIDANVTTRQIFSIGGREIEF